MATKALSLAAAGIALALSIQATGQTPAPSPTQAATPEGQLSIQADQPGATINRDIFGQFAEHLGRGIYGGIWVGKDSRIPNVRGIRSDVVGALRAIQVPVGALAGRVLCR